MYIFKVSSLSTHEIGVNASSMSPTTYSAPITRTPVRCSMSRSLSASPGPRRGSGALTGVQVHLADPHVVGGDLDALVLAAELQALLEAESLRRDQLLEVVRGGGAHVGLLLPTTSRS